jgi:hypothetical protein
MCTEDRTGAVAIRAALESAVQLGRGDLVNRQEDGQAYEMLGFATCGHAASSAHDCVRL